MKTTINKILLPTDFSSNAHRAHEFAIKLAKNFEAEIVLFHAFEVTISLSDDVVVKKDNDKTIIARDMRKVAQDNLVSLVGTSNKETGIHHSMLTCEGDVHREIASAIENEKIDLVVMGTKGKTADEGIFMGSITKGLLTEVSCPIIAIPEDANLENTISKIVYTTDLKDDEMHSVNYLNSLANVLDAEVFILHVAESGEKDNENAKSLKETITRFGYERVSYTALCNADIASGIYEFINTQQIDMLAMTTHNLSFLDGLFHQSLSKKMMLHTQIPFLSFNRKKNSITFFG